MGLQKETYYQVYTKFRKALIETTNVAQLATGSKARAFLETIASEFGTFYDNILYDITQSFLKYATGDMLDVFGDMFGVSRRPSSQASALVSEKSAKFYVDSGTFGDINSGNAITIPAGSRLTTAAGIGYVVTNEVTLGSTANETYIGVNAEKTGSTSNIGKEELIYHTFTSYTNSGLNGLKVTNNYAIANGADQESDTNFRFRISNRLIELERCNLFALYTAMLSIPGVRDIRIDRYANGLGTATVYLYGIYPEQSPQLVAQGTMIADIYSAVGDYVYVTYPDLVGVTIRTPLVFKKLRDSGIATAYEITTDQKDAIVERAEKNVEDYFKNLGIDEPLSIDKLTAVIVNTDNNILDIGDDTNSYDYILLHTTLPDGREVTKYTTSNYIPKVGEQIVLRNVDLYYE